MACQSRFDAQYWMLGAGALGQPRGMVRGGRRVEGSGWGTRVYLWQIHLDIWQNQYNIVKLKKKTKNWSELPFLSPMHESEKWKWSRSVISNSLWPHSLSLTRLLCPWNFPGKNIGTGCHFLSFFFLILFYFLNFT